MSKLNSVSSLRILGPILGLIFLNLIVSSSATTFDEFVTLTEKEKILLDQFKAIMIPRMPHDYMKTDLYLVRWLKASFYNVKEAEKKLMTNLEWREAQDIDNVLNENFDRFDENKYYMESFDKEGKPTLYVHVGQWDLRKIVVAGESEKFMRYVYRGLEECSTVVRDYANKYNNVTQGVMIFNLDGFNLIQHGCIRCITLFLRIIFEYELHYPLYVDKIYAINIPDIAQYVVPLARTTFHPITNKALKTFGTNKKKWFPELEKNFDLDQLPPELGGTKIYNKDRDEEF